MLPKRASDEQLIGRAAGVEDPSALGELLERHSRMVYSLGMRLFRDHGRAEELVQEAFTRLWTNAPDFDRGRGSVKTLLMTIARRTAIDMHRRAEARPELVSADEAQPPRAIEDQFSQVLSQLEIRAAMEELSQSHRIVVEMQFDRDMTQVQVADELGIPLGTVKSRSRNALRVMRGELEGGRDG